MIQMFTFKLTFAYFYTEENNCFIYDDPGGSNLTMMYSMCFQSVLLFYHGVVVVVGFTTTCAIRANHQSYNPFHVLDTALCDKVCQ